MASGPEDRLESWKEIAAYLKRGVRTVRRWEHEEGLPVHRHVHHVQGTVFASKAEVDAWQATRSRRPRAEPAPFSIAVLPFANLSADPDNAYFADGLAAEVTARLARVSTLRVISRTSSAIFKATAKSVEDVADDLGVRYVLDGSVRRDGTRLRITAQLIDAPADGHLWADTYDGTVDDVFAFQEQLARTIVDALQLRLTADENRRMVERPIADVKAYECYLQARQESWRWRADAIAHAIQLLRNGLAIIGDNAELHAAMGLAYLQYREAGVDYGDNPLREAERCVERVFAAGPPSAAGLRLRGWIHYARGRTRDAANDLVAALALAPQDADTLLLLSYCRLIAGSVAAARPLLDRLRLIDPLTPITRCMPAFADLLEGHLAAAVPPYRQMCEMDPGNPMARLFLAWVLVLNDQQDAARAIVSDSREEIRATMPGTIARFLVRLDERVDAATEAAAATSDVFARMLADGYAIGADHDRAMAWLRVAVDRGFTNHVFLEQHNRVLAPLRRDPRFVRLMATARERRAAFEQGT